MQGKFIVFEGTDGSGKTTQVELLRAYLEKKNYSHIAFDFPRYQDTFHAKTIQKYLSGEYGDPTAQNPYLASLAYALDRLTSREEIYYALNDGKIVLANRYIPSNKAHQGAKLLTAKRRDFFAWLDELEYAVNKMPREDLVLFLYTPYEFSMELSKERNRLIGGKEDLHEKNTKYQENVEKTYLQLAKGRHWEKIDCISDGRLRTKGDIHKEILAVLKKKGIIR
jgi:dTMP kinase